MQIIFRGGMSRVQADENNNQVNVHGGDGETNQPWLWVASKWATGIAYSK